MAAIRFLATSQPTAAAAGVLETGKAHWVGQVVVVAMAVLAEIQAVLNGRNDGSLRFRSASIHDSDPVLMAGRDQTDVAAEGCRLVAVQR